jgi:hypothetical protein
MEKQHQEKAQAFWQKTIEAGRAAQDSAPLQRSVPQADAAAWAEAKAEMARSDDAERYRREKTARERAERRASLVMPEPHAVAGITKARLMARR